MSERGEVSTLLFGVITDSSAARDDALDEHSTPFEDGEHEGPELAPVQREVLHEQIYGLLKRNLMVGRFVPGQKLPLRSLAKSLGTSLMPVRDALQRLESMGCLASTPLRTMVVPKYTQKELDDIRSLRMLLEGRAAEAAAVHRSDEHLARLEQHCIAIETSAQTADLDLFLEANYNFHMTIADASGICFIGSLLEPLWMRIGPSVRRSKPGQDHIRKAVGFHQSALRAIAAKDAGNARRVICEDILECNR
ncbi:GntR family transcriptional regulator [Ancylobacter sp. 6x-1]|uniref:GntR family transcriptional regulator n=1 Tax=Ancylobacter crimeensis TaxID=2579147 RepID=A0ABT0DD78_9HYPH|nr:GntR family transcriptional regulator [Ancylobacter crimeensis]MCK0197918.1 GntR family transcriptional regulator [Ancylobacter crimeensis]